MYIPVISKLQFNENVFIERVLPVEGEIQVEQGKDVVPYDHTGVCMYSHRVVNLPKNFKPKSFKKDGQFFYYGVDLGKVDSSKVTAPYNGNLFKKEDGTFLYKEVEGKYILLSGVWGNVDKIIEKRSVLIKTRTYDLNLVAATNLTFAGELIVFPNPSHVLEKFYLDEFTSGAADGKIVYVGNHVTINLLNEAIKYGLGGVIAGSADKRTFQYARKNNICFGLFSGFGDIPTPDDVYKVLNEVTNRYVFFQGERSILRIPMPPEATPVKMKTSGPLKFVKKGMQVVVLQKPYFGKIGIVDRNTESSIFVKFNSTENAVEVRVPNVYAID
ncbi:hypothetical protein C4561_02570 [candidate division WWE3 bacterium]|uniref:KOW domain-containing protein n=1 Tax=candidate division WWE3 bacterium TaxID=2053526 RepID=A0A3A4ZKR7_UNCKA|nr:MAG: hypothetical protein C4561_02570 [candidate division WWE3 bacterium]